MTFNSSGQSTSARPVSPQLFSITARWEHPYTLDDLLPTAELVWLKDGEGLLGFGEVARHEVSGQNRFMDAQEWWASLTQGENEAAESADDDADNNDGAESNNDGGRLHRHELGRGEDPREADFEDSDPEDSDDEAFVEDPRLAAIPGTGAVAFSALTFSAHSASPSFLVVPRLVVGRRGNDMWVSLIGLGADKVSAAVTEQDLHREVQKLLAHPALRTHTPMSSGERQGSHLVSKGTIAVRPGARDEQEWMDTVSQALELIAQGTLSKLVLAREIVVSSTAPISPSAVVQNLAESYQQCWTYRVGALVGATPELLIRSNHGFASAKVLAGTLDRRNAPENPARRAAYLATHLSASPKQINEHRIAVHSLTEQLRPYTCDLNTSSPFVLELPNVWHLATDVSARLRKGGEQVASCFTLVDAVHPTAAVCGTPTEVAAQTIAAIEGIDRGTYAGPVGWVDASGNGEFGIALRGGVFESEHQIRLYAGCGIVTGSDPAQELAETHTKLRPMLQALGVSEPAATSDNSAVSNSAVSSGTAVSASTGESYAEQSSADMPAQAELPGHPLAAQIGAQITVQK